MTDACDFGFWLPVDELIWLWARIRSRSSRLITSRIWIAGFHSLFASWCFTYFLSTSIDQPNLSLFTHAAVPQSTRFLKNNQSMLRLNVINDWQLKLDNDSCCSAGLLWQNTSEFSHFFSHLTHIIRMSVIRVQFSVFPFHFLVIIRFCQIAVSS